MHYKNGREAKDGDPVICKGYNGETTVGKIHSLIAGSTSCNCSVAEVVMGGVNQLTCKIVGDLYHADDAIKCIETLETEIKKQVAKDVAAAEA
jgi:hypothetical protein